MKKILSIVLVVGMLFSLMSTAVYATDVSELTTGEKALLLMQRADINGDKQYSTDDVAILLKAAAGIIEIPDIDMYDLDFDGYVTVRDAQLMLKVVSDVAPLVSEEESLEVFNLLLNGVKSIKPGFDKTATVVCPTVKVTASGYPALLNSMNATNMEYKDYVNKAVKLMESVGTSEEELADLKQSATDIYTPQTETKTIAATSNSHYTNFPVNNLGWSSKLTIDDVKSVNYAVEDGYLVYTVKMNNYTYKGDQYPTGSTGFSGRQQLPYGKVFNLPALQEDDKTTLNSIQLKNGVIVVKADIITGEIVSADYSYSYITDIVSINDVDSYTITMKMVTTTNVKENYVMNVG